jgi:type VI secretion system secreted protein VgrG
MKARLGFDRLGKKDDTASCWIRVLQAPLGGSMMVARVGWEMAVRYVDGDPDRPIAVSRMYDGNNVAPEVLPSFGAASAWHTLSSPGGEKVNAIRIHDKAGNMEFDLLAGKDMDGTVLRDKAETVGVDEAIEVGVDATAFVDKDQTLKVGADQTVTVAKDAGVAVAVDRTKEILQAEAVRVDGGVSSKVGGQDLERVGGDRTVKVAKDVTENVEGDHGTTVGASVSTTSRGDHVRYVAGDASETVGGTKSVTTSSGAVTERVGADRSLRVGGASVATAQGQHVESSEGDTKVTVGAVKSLTAGGKFQVNARKIQFVVAGVASFVGGGGIVTLTPASATFIGLVTVKGTGGVEVTGLPNLIA